MSADLPDVPAINVTACASSVGSIEVSTRNFLPVKIPVALMALMARDAPPAGKLPLPLIESPIMIGSLLQADFEEIINAKDQAAKALPATEA